MQCRSVVVDVLSMQGNIPPLPEDHPKQDSEAQALKLSHYAVLSQQAACESRKPKEGLSPRLLTVPAPRYYQPCQHTGQAVLRTWLVNI